MAAPPYSTLECVPLFGYVGEATHFAQNPENWNYYLPVLRNRSPSVVLVSSFPRLHCLGAAHSSADMAENCDIMDICHSLLDINTHEKQSLSKEVPSVNDSSDSLSKEEKERQRRKKIGQANKGRIPWNKGRKHSSGK